MALRFFSGPVSRAITKQVHYAELNIARTAVLDYFQSPAQKQLDKIFTWEDDFKLRPGKCR